jgi:hypothetical protein
VGGEWGGGRRQEPRSRKRKMLMRPKGWHSWRPPRLPKIPSFCFRRPQAPPPRPPPPSPPPLLPTADGGCTISPRREPCLRFEISRELDGEQGPPPRPHPLIPSPWPWPTATHDPRPTLIFELRRSGASILKILPRPLLKLTLRKLFYLDAFLPQSTFMLILTQKVNCRCCANCRAHATQHHWR